MTLLLEVEPKNIEEKNDIWKLVSPPNDKSIVGTMWIFRNKLDRMSDTFPNHVFKLKNALYGLKQAPRAWYEKMSLFLVTNGFQREKLYATLFCNNYDSHFVIIQIYVDEIIFGATNDSLYEEFFELMQKEFEMNMIGE
ncbi:hypothetical protein CR513_29821, partial [Mucuna pruriens]